MYLDDFDEFLINNLFENKNSDTLPFIITERLFKILEKINHPIAEELIKLNDKKEEKNVTFIDYDDNIFSPNDDLDTIYKRFTFLNSNKAIDNISKTNNLSLDKIKTYINDSETLTSNNYNVEWFKKSRSVIKIGSFIKKIFGDKFKDAGDTDNDITSFVNIFSSKRKALEQGYTGFELVKGDDIVYWYDGYNYSDGGTINSSCMRYSDCSNYIKFYSINNKTISLLILRDPLDYEKIVGRALVWKLTKPEDRYFMDRIYYTSDKYIEIFKNYAKENGWLYKKDQNMNEQSEIIDSIDDTSKKRTLVSECITHDEFPYMDTMKYFCSEDGKISNDIDYINNGDIYYILTNTDGGYETVNEGIYVEYYDAYIDEDDLIWCEYGDEYRLSDDAIYLGDEFDNEYATLEYVKIHFEWSECNDRYIEKELAIWSDYDDSYISKDDALEIIISANYDTFEEAIEDDDNKEYRDDSNRSIAYYKNNNYYYFDTNNDDDFFILVNSKNGNVYKHKIWDKNFLFKINNKKYYVDDIKELDYLNGQLRLFDK